jgi:diguanylate cyclase (GGDEF)-like protein/PAS domain S-box-containing protein
VLRNDPTNILDATDDERVAIALAKLARVSHDLSNSPRDVETKAIAPVALLYATALDNISQGVCFFDGGKRLLLSNRRYAEIYRLTLEQVQPGVTLREIAELRFAIGSCPDDVEDYLSWCAAISLVTEPKTWIADLKDGRSILITHQPMPDGGWVATHEDITEQKAIRQIASERMHLQALIDWVPDYLWVKDIHGRFVVANKALAFDSGKVRTGDMIGLDDFQLHAAETAREFRRREEEILLSGKPAIDLEEVVVDRNGGTKWLSTAKVPLLDEKGQAFGLIGIGRDITARRLANALRDGHANILEMIARSAPVRDVLEQLMLLVESQTQGIYGSVLLLDEDGMRLRHGAAPSLPEAYARLIDGIAIGPKVGSCGTAVFRREPVIVSDIPADPLWEDFRHLVEPYGYRSCWSTPIFSHEGAVLGAFAMYSKQTRVPTQAEIRLVESTTHIAGIAIERRRAEDRIQFMASHDSLTGLPNRTMLKDRLAEALAPARRLERSVTVVFVDLDNFKVINDSLGHNAGDELLKVIAQRMVNCVRVTDTVVRLGGDEFVLLLLDDPKKPRIVSAILDKLRAAIAEPVRLENRDFSISGSFGVAIYPKDGDDAEMLVANADAAMYRAKETGRDNIQFYTPELNTKIRERLLIQEELRNAIARSEFTLLCQPQVDSRTQRIFAVEALIRWNHPTLGAVSPDRFIPFAEQNGAIVAIGDWVLREACRQNKIWQEAGLAPRTVCVNVSARQFRERGLVGRVAEALQQSGLEPQYLELELTESVIMQDVARAVATMFELRKLGVRLSIDDFGTGYSSLAALKNFPVGRLKIDKSFIADLHKGESDKAVVSAVISLGQKLNLRVIAEGVETADQVAFLRDNDCDEMQGYYFGRPLPPDEFEKLARES